MEIIEMKKKLIAYALTSALFFTTAFCGMTAPVHATEVKESDLPEITFDQPTFIRDSETGHIYMEDDYLTKYHLIRLMLHHMEHTVRSRTSILLHVTRDPMGHAGHMQLQPVQNLTL